jgi:DNA-binding CsgD family transcriptional regulator
MLSTERVNSDEVIDKVYKNKKEYNLSPFAFIILDLKNKDLRFKDNSFERLTGYDNQYFHKNGLEKLLELLPWSNLMGVVKTLVEVRTKVKNAYESNDLDDILINYYHQIVDSKGGKKNVLTQISKLVNVDNQSPLIVLTCHDLSHLIRSTKLKLYVFSRKENRIVEAIEPKEYRNVLTTKESEIFGLLRDGYMEKEIADELCISISTVKNHKQNVFKKLNVNRTIEALKALKDDF